MLLSKDIYCMEDLSKNNTPSHIANGILVRENNSTKPYNFYNILPERYSYATSNARPFVVETQNNTCYFCDNNNKIIPISILSTATTNEKEQTFIIPVKNNKFFIYLSYLSENQTKDIFDPTKETMFINIYSKSNSDSPYDNDNDDPYSCNLYKIIKEK